MVNKVLCVVVSLSIAMLHCAVNATTGSPTSYQTDAEELPAASKKHQCFYLCLWTNNEL